MSAPAQQTTYDPVTGEVSVATTRQGGQGEKGLVGVSGSESGVYGKSVPGVSGKNINRPIADLTVTTMDDDDDDDRQCDGRTHIITRIKSVDPLVRTPTNPSSPP